MVADRVNRWVWISTEWKYFYTNFVLKNAAFSFVHATGPETNLFVLYEWCAFRWGTGGGGNIWEFVISDFIFCKV